MSTHKHIDKICCVVLVLTLLLSSLFMFAGALGVESASHVIGYENRIFDTSRVHTVDIVMNDWDSFLETCTNEEYATCNVVIDGEAYKNVAIRAKGNTSLSSVKSMDSDRYSFKIEFDHYDSTKSYHGLDKLCLNNVIQDNTYMKDYLTYQMMNEFGVAAPLCSYVSITVNGEDWGLYLAVEAVEDSFLLRNYGNSYGELYKPDSMSMGGGRGNGKDFNIEDWEGFDDIFGNGLELPENPFEGGMTFPEREQAQANGAFPDMSGETRRPENMGGIGGMDGMFGMGSSDVKLQYIDDDPNSYSNIFGNAKTDVSEADQDRLISSLKQLSAYENLESVVDIEQVIRYFIVHNYVVNGDSYTGSMIHNYYLYEEEGRLSMIPWDYNLAFGTFQGANASSSVNQSIDEVLSDRPMQAWIFSSEEYSAQYYALYAEMLESVNPQAIIEHAYGLIAPYVQEDPTAFCSAEEFEKGVQVLKEFCLLRSESVALQLNGSEATVDTGDLNISDMGSMGSGFGGNRENGGFEGNMQGPNVGQDGMTFPNNQGGNITPSDMTQDGNMVPPDMAQGGDMSGTNFPSGMPQRPTVNEGDTNRAPQGNRFEDTDAPSASPASSNGMTALIVSFAVLAAGLVFVLLFKRRKDQI